MEKNKKNFYILMGSENAELKERLTKIINNTTEEDAFGTLSLSKLDCEEESIKNVISEFKTIPFGAVSKTVVLNNFDAIIKNENSFKEFDEYLKNPVSSVVHIFVLNEIFNEKSSSKNAKIFLNKIKNFKNEILVFNKLKENSIYKWIKEKFSAENIQIDEESLELLTNYCNGDTAYIFPEIEKLITFAKEKNEITIEEAELLTQNIRTDIIFQMIDAIVSNNIVDYLIKLNLLKYQSNYPNVHILTLLDSFEILYYCKEKNLLNQNEISSNKNLPIAKGRAYFIEQQLKKIKNVAILKNVIKNIKNFELHQKLSYFTNYNILLEEIYL